MGPWEEERASGEESGEGEVLVAPEWLGQWRRQELPERKKTTFSLRLTAKGAREVWCEAASMHGGARGPPFIAHPSQFAAARPWISLSATAVL